MKQSTNPQITQSPVKGLRAIVMGAGHGKRMRSKLAKVLHPVAGRPMILYAVELAGRVAGEGIAVVVGYQGDRVRPLLEASGRSPAPVSSSANGPKPAPSSTGLLGNHAWSPLVVEQAQQLGTGHAVMQAHAAFQRARGGSASAYVILNGDTPLLKESTLRELVRQHETDNAAVTILTAVLEDPTGYGRVVRDKTDGRNDRAKGRVRRIVEDRDAGADELRLCEVNVGTYVVEAAFLSEALQKLQPQNVQREYYLTDIVGEAVERGLQVSALTLRDPDEGVGINTRQQLAAVEQAVRRQICDRWMQAGITIRDPATTYIDAEVEIGQDTVLHPNVMLEGQTRIGEDCVIRPQTHIAESVLGDRVTVLDCCVIRESRLEDGSTVGPFAHLRPGTAVRRGAKVGNFVEMKKADLGEGSKANHLSYLGDTRIGKGVNIGAGTITCNYDGLRKYETVIEDEVFVGSDTQLIAPVTVGRGAVIAAGTTVTQDVPADALAIARTTQSNRPGWAARRRALPPRGDSVSSEPQVGSSKFGVRKPRASNSEPRATAREPLVVPRSRTAGKSKRAGKK